MRATGARTHVWNNGLKSAALLALFPVFISMVAYAVLLVAAGLEGHDVGEAFSVAALNLPSAAPWAFGAVAVWFAVAYFLNVRILAAATGAKSVTRKEEPLLYNLLENLCIARGMPMPALRVMETPALNAYASGLNRKQYTVAVTRGLLERLEPAEIEAVLAHELAHIRHGDVRLMVVASVFVGAVAIVADAIMRNGDVIMRAMSSGSSSSSRRGSGKNNGGGGAVALVVLVLAALAILLVARVLSVLTQMALSRTREFMADMDAALATRNPDAMVSALIKISQRPDVEGVPGVVRGMFFENASSSFSGLLSTHPPVTARIKALVEYGGATNPWPGHKRPAIIIDET